MGGPNPNRGLGPSFRPLLESDVKLAQSVSQSEREAARYLRVSFQTYKKYAQLYGLYGKIKNQSGRGLPKNKLKGKFGLDEILEGKHPHYDRKTLKLRLIRAGYLKEECALCGFNQKRAIDSRCPLVLNYVDGDLYNLNLDNLLLYCYNCHYLCTGKVSAKRVVNEGVFDQDLLDTGLSMDEIERMQDELFVGDE